MGTMLYYGSIKERPIGQAVKTTPSHGVNPGSIPGLVIQICMCSSSVERQLPKLERWVRFPSRALEDTPKISELLERAEILGDFCYTNMCA